MATEHVNLTRTQAEELHENIKQRRIFPAKGIFSYFEN